MRRDRNAADIAFQTAEVTCGGEIVQQNLESGTLLRNRYEILELVGQGGMGAVYKASDRRLEGRVCAVKEVLPTLTHSALNEQEVDQMAEQFRVEASILSRLDHPNLPKVSDYFAENGREYLVMDFVDGRDLEELLREAQQQGVLLQEEQVLGWSVQLLDALEYLHSQTPTVLHRDIKPSNIKVTPRGLVKLVDFGLVKVLQPDDTRTVTVVQGRGTIAYTPLEQYGGDTGFTDVRSDIYALGATMYHLLAGAPPVDAKERFLHPGCLRSLRDLNPQVSARCERAIFQAMAMHPNERPANVGQFRGLLFGASAALAPAPRGALASIGEPSWHSVLVQNRDLLAVGAGLLAIATIISLL